MDLDIRKAVLGNLTNANSDVVRSTINDAMSIQEEKVLPGLGVLFETYWRNSSEEERSKVIQVITNAVKG